MINLSKNMDNSRLIQLINGMVSLAPRSYGGCQIFIELERLETQTPKNNPFCLHHKAINEFKGKGERKTNGLVISLEERENIEDILEGKVVGLLNFNTPLSHFNTEDSNKLIIFYNGLIDTDCLSTADYISIPYGENYALGTA